MLVTGASGFVGTHLCQALRRRRARGAGDDAAPGPLRRPRRRPVYGDVGDADEPRRGRARRRRRVLPRALAGLRRLRGQGRGRRAATSAAPRPRRAWNGSSTSVASGVDDGELSAAPALAAPGRAAARRSPAFRSPCCARPSSSATAASRGRSPASSSTTCRRWSRRGGSTRAPSRSRCATSSATSSACSSTPRRRGRVFEIGGPEVLRYIDMLKRAAAVQGKRLPSVGVPLLSPKLSSRWLALVTDVDIATARNLVESMTTEVVVKRPRRSRRSCPGDDGLRRRRSARHCEDRASRERASWIGSALWRHAAGARGRARPDRQGAARPRPARQRVPPSAHRRRRRARHRRHAARHLARGQARRRAVLPADARRRRDLDRRRPAVRAAASRLRARFAAACAARHHAVRHRADRGRESSCSGRWSCARSGRCATTWSTCSSTRARATSG